MPMPMFAIVSWSYDGQPESRPQERLRSVHHNPSVALELAYRLDRRHGDATFGYVALDLRSGLPIDPAKPDAVWSF